MAQYESTKTGAQIDAAVENSGKVSVQALDGDGYFLLTNGTSNTLPSTENPRATKDNASGEISYSFSDNTVIFKATNTAAVTEPRIQMVKAAGQIYSYLTSSKLYINKSSVGTNIDGNTVTVFGNSKKVELTGNTVSLSAPGPSTATVTLTGGWNSNYSSKELGVNADIRATGAAYATAFNQTSDERLKTVTEKDVTLDVNDIAEAPIVKFYFKEDDKKIAKIGTLAQYWDKIIPEAITKEGKEGYMSMQYDVAALASVVSMAKKIIEQEERINTLEEEIKKLKNA